MVLGRCNTSARQDTSYTLEFWSFQILPFVYFIIISGIILFLGMKITFLFVMFNGYNDFER